MFACGCACPPAGPCWYPDCYEFWCHSSAVCQSEWFMSFRKTFIRAHARQDKWQGTKGETHLHSKPRWSRCPFLKLTIAGTLQRNSTWWCCHPPPDSFHSADCRAPLAETERSCSVCIDLAAFCTISLPDMETALSVNLQTETHRRLAAQIQTVPPEPIG